ncbi:tetratricopeptide-like helical [Apiospora phragmitis]|uniref:Tetratricopeptide-like helical n=1 Tax=Apiospora phragmitis TaxID=2905665 RepID=A0ABR1VDH2_9PEZI
MFGWLATRPRSSTKGPLDADEAPLKSPVVAQVAQAARGLSPQFRGSRSNSPFRSSSPFRAGSPFRASSPFPRSPARSSTPSGIVPVGERDFSHLLRPEIFHQLSPLSIPPPFRNTSKQPTPETPISELLAHGQFRAAAITSVQALTSSPVSATIAAAHPPVDPSDYARVFSLLYIRLACLCLIDSVPLAAQEAKALEDLNQAYYLDPITGAHLMPWELRLLAIRLQTMGFGDPRRAIMSYYEMAREAHLQIAKAAKAHDHSELELWKRRLAELGIRVAGALIEMEDLAGAAAHMATLRDQAQDGKLATAKALLWLHLGDVDAACRCVRDGKGGDVGEKVVLALVDMANGQFEDGLKKWTELKAELEESGIQDEMVGVNLAVCLLYLGRMQEGRQILEGLVDDGQSSRTLLFNLSTMYELCTDRAKALKVRLADRVSNLEPTSHGWEKTNADFKL